MQRKGMCFRAIKKVEELVECLPSKRETLSSNPSTTEKKKKKERRWKRGSFETT
jgi:hypothetical protein